MEPSNFSIQLKTYFPFEFLKPGALKGFFAEDNCSDCLTFTVNTVLSVSLLSGTGYLLGTITSVALENLDLIQAARATSSFSTGLFNLFAGTALSVLGCGTVGLIFDKIMAVADYLDEISEKMS